MTRQECLDALAPLGFTPRQTQFVATVARHSGYCLRRQYAAAAGLAYGKNVRAFLDTLVSRELASRVTYRANRGHLYHLQARAIYRALGQEDDRHRRYASTALIARRLMLLDTVLGDPNVEWYATEAEKVALFTTRFNVASEDLPRGTSHDDSKDGAPVARYFGHKLPIAVAGEPPRVRFVYLATELGTRPFARFIGDHAALLRRLPAWTIVVAQPASTVGTPHWETAFHEVVEATVWQSGSAVDALRQHFVTRARGEGLASGLVRPEDRATYEAMRLRFSSAAIDAAYRTWLASRTSQAEPALLRSVLPRAGQLVVRVLPFRYQQFGDFPGVL